MSSKMRFLDNNFFGYLADGITLNCEVLNAYSLPDYVENLVSPVRSASFSLRYNVGRITIDLSTPMKVTAVALFGPISLPLDILPGSTVKIMGDNVDDHFWLNPEFELSLTVNNDRNVVGFIDPETAPSYRFWAFKVDNPYMEDKPFSISTLYIGDYTETTLRNVSTGIGWDTKDPSKTIKSLDGTAYHEVRPKYDTFKSMKYSFVQNQDRLILEQLYDRMGQSEWMPISIDPDGCLTDGDGSQLTRLARFSSDLKRKHKALDYWDVSFSLEEVV